MNKIYILQRDLPNVNKGAKIFLFADGYICLDKFGGTEAFNKNLIENNTEWFLPEQQPLPIGTKVFDKSYGGYYIKTKEHHWNDVSDKKKMCYVDESEVGKRFIIVETYPIGTRVKDNVREYEKSWDRNWYRVGTKLKTIIPENEIGDGKRYIIVPENDYVTLESQIYKFLKYRKDLHEYLNKIKPQNNKKEWEIIEVDNNTISEDRGYLKRDKRQIEIIVNSGFKNGWFIKSVRRIKDNVVFSIGTKTFDGVIKGFEFIGNELYANFHPKEINPIPLSINNLSKPNSI